MRLLQGFERLLTGIISQSVSEMGRSGAAKDEK
jgi:hypothetical protein